MMGKMPKILKTKSSKQPQLKWKTRKENQIKSIRAELSILTDMAQKGETQKISKKKQRIKSKYKITRIPQNENSSKSPKNQETCKKK